MADTYTIDDIRLWISLAVIGQQLLVTLVFLKNRPLDKAQWLGALMLLGFVAYLVQSNPLLREVLAVFWPVTAALALAAPYLLWEFSIAIFEIRFVPGSIRYVVYAVPLTVWLIIVGMAEPSAQLIGKADALHHVVALALIAHAVIAVYLDRRDDLLEPRRRYRALFVVFISLQASAILIVELVFGFANIPDWLELTNVIMIAILTVGLMYPLLQLDGKILWHAAPQSDADGQRERIENLAPADRVMRDALAAAMAAGIYRTLALGIRELATELNVPEHQLRKLINQHLGYRNFSAFLNHRRIQDARLQLADAAMVRIPVLTIAMDLGYGSIGPFNRAFKEATGLTPTAFRQQKLGETNTDSG